MAQVFEEKKITVLEDVRNKAAKDKLLMETSVLKNLLMDLEGLSEEQAEDKIKGMCQLTRKEFYDKYKEVLEDLSKKAS